MRAWIAEHVPPNPVAMCRRISEEMCEAFPELRRVRGHYYGGGMQHAHWWCELPDGTVVDPTAAQFPPGGRYVEYTGPDPLGKCPNCGELVWEDKGGGRDFCDRVCHDAYLRYLIDPYNP